MPINSDEELVKLQGKSLSELEVVCDKCRSSTLLPDECGECLLRLFKRELELYTINLCPCVDG